MSGPRAALIPGGRLHLQHGPIDLIIGAEGANGARAAAFAAARARFATLLEELVGELPALRRPAGTQAFTGATARRMAAAVAPFGGVFVTPMAAVAGAVAEEVLAAMVAATVLVRAWVNNGGDIALHSGQAAPGSHRAGFSVAIAATDASPLGTIAIPPESGVRGIATSGAGGRSLSLGIADSVTVLARSAAAADAAATLIANAVDLPGHAAIARTPACHLQPDSDLGARPVVTAVGRLTAAEIGAALDSGAACAQHMRARGLIHSAALFLRGRHRLSGPLPLARHPTSAPTSAPMCAPASTPARKAEHA